MGRWATMDPLQYEAGDVNLYTHNFNNPIVYTDETGLAVGHHLVGQALTKDCEKHNDKCNKPENRLFTEGYTQHNGKKYGEITNVQYNTCVSELTKTMFPNSKGDVCKLSMEDLDKLIEAVMNAPADSCIGKYNKAVEKEIRDQTKKDDKGIVMKDKKGKDIMLEPDYPLPAKPKPPKMPSDPTKGIKYPPIPEANK